MNFFPICTNLEGRTVFLQGFGLHAIEKLEKILPYGAIIHIFNENDDLGYAAHPQILFKGRCIAEEDLSCDPVFVVTADIPRKDAENIFHWCTARNIPVNCVDVPDLCSFYFPALVTKGAFTMAISTSGKSPAAASILRKKLEDNIPDNIDRILEWSEETRSRLKTSHPDPADRRKILRKAVAFALEENRIPSQDEMDKIINAKKSRYP